MSWVSFTFATSILDVSQFVKMLWFMRLYHEILIVVLSFFSAVTSVLQRFTCKLCLQFSGQRMRNFTWNRNREIDLGTKPRLLLGYRLGNRDVFEVQHSSQSISLPAHSNSSLPWKTYCTWLHGDCSQDGKKSKNRADVEGYLIQKNLGRNSPSFSDDL